MADEAEIDAERAAQAAADEAAAADDLFGDGGADDDMGLGQAPQQAQAPQRRNRRIAASDDEEEEDVFGGHEGGGAARADNGAGPSGVNRGHDWGGLDAAALNGLEARDRAQAQQQHADAANGADVGADDDARSNAGMSDGNSMGDGPLYEGYDESILKHPEVAQPMLLAQDELWKCIESIGPTEMRPKRAMRLNVPVDFFRRDAEFFRQWCLPKGSESRCRATAALVSLLFAGMQMGFPSGKHEEKMRQQVQNEEQDQQAGAAGGGRSAGKAKVTPFTHAKRYTYAPHDDETDSWPMFQIALEDIYNDDRTEVMCLGVWLIIFDENHSTSALVRRVVENTHNLKTAKSVSSASAGSRNKDASAEADRHGKAGFGFQAIRDNFEGTVGLQYENVATMEDWKRLLDLHSGATSGRPGRPCVRDLSKHINCAAGRRRLEGDSKTGCGGKHPMAPELVFNAKRRESLEFGMVNLDGTNMDVCDEQCQPSTYWTSDGHFCIPQIGIPCFWICTSVEKKTIFELPLTRPLQGTVTPGEALMKLFLEQEVRQRYIDMGTPNRRIFEHQLRIDQNAMNRLRSLATCRDEHQRRQDSLLRNALISYDLMTPATNTALGEGAVDFNPEASGEEANYTIKTTSMTQRVSKETDRIYTKVVQPYHSRMEKEFAEMAKPLQEEEVPSDDPQWDAYFAKRAAFNERFYAVKKDLTQYHLRLLRTCFLSTKDAATLPSGYKAMFKGLEDGVRDHEGSASIAFNGGKDGMGRQMMCKDRQVWGNLQEWLRYIFVDCCKIDGRDRRIMDEIYLHVFEMYANTTFVLVIASEKGKGKSVRAMRMGSILPDGWVSYNSATTQRSGMNGNNSPSNGTTVICDEMISDLTPAEPTERMEFWKTIVGKRQYEIERTRLIKNADGTESHMTFKIVTDHAETYLVCCNMGQCFTAGNEEPTAGKEAMVQRTVCLQARAEADSDSPEADFKANLKHPEVSPAISDFRLFTSLCGYVRMAMMGVDWLQPDFAIANLIFKEGDRMLTDEYAKPKPEPRRLVKRTENLTTMCVHEAVARVYFFKQTAVSYDAGRPDRNGRGKKFEIGDLWDVLRTLRPTREMILSAWAHSLEYSIGTSSHGCNVMTAICEKLGMVIDYIFKKLPTGRAEELVGASNSAFEFDSFMTEVRQNVAGGSSGSDGVGANKSTLETYETRLRESRILRNDFRKKAVDKPQESQQPVQAIKGVVGEPKALKYSDALFPNAATAAMYYKPNTLLQWATGRRVAREDMHSARGGALHFKEKENRGGAKEFDFAWLVLWNTGSTDKAPSWNGLVKEKMRDSHNVNIFDMHAAGVADAMFMLASTENSQLLAEAPRLPWSVRSSIAFVDQNGNMPGKESVTVGLRPLTIAGQQQQTEAHVGEVVPVRLRSGANHTSRTPFHRELDNMHQRCRLPALQPHTSTKITRAPPLRRSDGAVEVNSVAAYEHVVMIMEGILRCSRMPGLKGLQERFQSKGTPPPCLKAPNFESALEGQQLLDTVRVLPYSIDLMQMAWTLDLANRMYTPMRNAVRDSFNAMVQAHDLGTMIGVSELPELTLRYPGFPPSSADKTEALRLISTKTNVNRPVGQTPIDIATSNPLMDLDPELLRYETEIAIGGTATDADIEEHRRSLIGSGYTWGVTGDVFCYDTWAEHLSASMLGRGNTDGKTDEMGKYTDLAHVSVLDAEFMFEARLVERRCEQRWDGYAHLGITSPSGSTYSWLEANPRPAAQPGQKRARLQEPPRMRQAVAARLSNQYAVAPAARQPQQPGAGRPQGLALRYGDSRFE